MTLTPLTKINEDEGNSTNSLFLREAAMRSGGPLNPEWKREDEADD